MAPGKTSELRLGDLVLAKVKVSRLACQGKACENLVLIPLYIRRPEDHDKTPDPQKYIVEFFGTQEIAVITPADIRPFTSEKKIELRAKSKSLRFFPEAVEQICEALKKLQHKDLTSMRNGITTPSPAS